MNNKERFSALFKRWSAWMWIGAALLIASGCGSGSESLSADSGGIGGSGVTSSSVSIGEVSDYGSIFVDGIEWQTDQAEIYVEGNLAGTGDRAVLDHLPIGQRVVVQGEMDSDSAGTALRVDAFYYVQGPVWDIDYIDDQTFSLNVMGQTVLVDAQTTMDRIPMNTFPNGMVLQVSGAVDATGVIHAGYIAQVADAMSPGATVAVKGHAQRLNLIENYFMINDLVVDCSQVRNASELLAGEESIAVQGVLTDGILTNRILIATDIQPFDTETFDSVEYFSMDGFITATLSVSQWRMGQYRIQTDAATWFEGLAPEDLTTGIRVLVQGQLKDRLVEASRVKLINIVRMESNVAAVDLENRTITLAGMEEIPIQVNILTHIHGDARTLYGIEPGDHVSIYGNYRYDGSVVAIDIFNNFTGFLNSRFILQGPVTEIADSAFILMGTAIDTNANQGIAFYDMDWLSLVWVPLPVDKFLSTLAIGSLARVTGRWEDTQLHYESLVIVR